jgi:hypothetical protein
MGTLPQKGKQDKGFVPRAASLPQHAPCEPKPFSLNDPGSKGIGTDKALEQGQGNDLEIEP